MPEPGALRPARVQSSVLSVGGQPASILQLSVRRQGALNGLANVVKVLNQSWLTRIGLVLIVIFVCLGVFGPILFGDPRAQSVDVLQPPGPGHWFGTDHLGRDILARTAAGTQVSLVVAFVSVALGLVIALPLGMTAGYFGGTWIDEVLMRAVDVILALPLFMLALVFLGVIGNGPGKIGPVEFGGAWKVVILIAISIVPKFARVARAATLVEKQEDYVDSLHVIGVSRLTIAREEILINVLPPVLVQAMLWMALAIFTEAALSFLGLGVQPPDATLGNMLHDARDYILVGAWWYSVFPGLVLILAIVGLNLLGDGMSDVLDPRFR